MANNTPIELQALRDIFSDTRIHIGLGIVKQVEVLADKSNCKVKVAIIPEMREIIAIYAWDDIGPNAGSGAIPVAKDLVLVANAEGNEDFCYIIKKLSSKEDTIPKQGVDGHWFARAKLGKKAYLLSEEKIIIGKGTTADGADPEEPLVLGEVLKSFLGDLFDEILNAPQIGQCAVGPVMLDPTLRTNLTTMKQTYITDAATNILSQIAFTERGE